MVISAGQKVCVTSTGSLSGLILVNGGELCNEGTITSPSIAMSGGAITNMGTMNNQELGITDGTFTNMGAANIDSLSIDGATITLMNMGTLTSIGIAQNASGTGGIPALHNMGSGSVTCDSILISGGEVHNHGSFDVNFHIANFSPALFQNHCSMTVGGNFANTGSFLTEKMITIGGDFGNSGTITGPTTGCGGFAVSGASGNSGDFGADGSNLDICDGGTSGFDSNTGTLGSSVTTCSCSDMCAVAISEQASFDFDLFPNPATDFIEVKSDTDMVGANYEIFNLQGQLLATGQFNRHQTRITTKWEAGTYLIVVRKTGNTPSKHLFVLE